MTNKEIAQSFKLLANLMELYGENSFKIRSYMNGYNILKKIEFPIADMSESQLSEMDGIGKAVSSKVMELIQTGQMAVLQELTQQTPEGIIDMLKVRGLGPKKVRTIWDELEIETVGELIQACEENRLIALKGFGKKTQLDIKNKLAYFQLSKGKQLYANAEAAILSFKEWMNSWTESNWCFTGALARVEPIIDGIELVIDESISELFSSKLQSNDQADWIGNHVHWEGIPLRWEVSSEFEKSSFLLSYHQDFLNQHDSWTIEKGDNFQDICLKNKTPFVIPAQSECFDAENRCQTDELIQLSDVKGIVHCHSTYSDGLHTLKEMAQYAYTSGFEYMLITDHSKSAFYANGLQVERVYQQFEEIEKLNHAFAKKDIAFKIFKGIESDILSDGSLDYTDDVLKDFDCIIASIHSNLKMDIAKATHRLIRAIENPYTKMLGHPTGRLLLSREGYPIDHSKIIDACANNGVAIEINANPSRLDIDYRWIDECLSKGVKLSINPDAHSKEAMHLIRYGVIVGRKAWLKPSDNISSLSLSAFEQFVAKK